MRKIQREDIHTVSMHSNLTEQAVDKALRENVYHDRQAWQKFLQLLFFCLGIGFTVSGLIFFFAYNWAALHKFVKIGLIEGLLIATIMWVVLLRVKTIYKDILLTAASLIVGVLFAVYGQVYQTGANAYDFFLAWTIFVALWVWVANFAPLWLLFMLLLNTTLILYAQQVAQDWSEVTLSTLLFTINAFAWIVAHRYRQKGAPKWFIYTMALSAICFATMGIVIGILDKFYFLFPFLTIVTAITYGLGLWYGIKSKNSFYLSAIPFSLIIIISSLFMKISDDAPMFLLVSLFIVCSVTFTIKNLIDIQRAKSNDT